LTIQALNSVRDATTAKELRVETWKTKKELMSSAPVRSDYNGGGGRAASIRDARAGTGTGTWRTLSAIVAPKERNANAPGPGESRETMASTQSELGTLRESSTSFADVVNGARESAAAADAQGEGGGKGGGGDDGGDDDDDGGGGGGGGGYDNRRTIGAQGGIAAGCSAAAAGGGGGAASPPKEPSELGLRVRVDPHHHEPASYGGRKSGDGATYGDGSPERERTSPVRGGSHHAATPVVGALGISGGKPLGKDVIAAWKAHRRRPTPRTRICTRSSPD